MTKEEFQKFIAESEKLTDAEKENMLKLEVSYEDLPTYDEASIIVFKDVSEFINTIAEDYDELPGIMLDFIYDYSDLFMEYVVNCNAWDFYLESGRVVRFQYDY